MGLDQYAYLRNKDSKLNGAITDEDLTILNMSGANIQGFKSLCGIYIERKTQTHIKAILD